MTPSSENERPSTYFDVGLQHERTELAWERTSIAMMAAGVVLARLAAIDGYFVLAALGLAEAAVGGTVLLWSARHYEELHGMLHAGDPVVHPTAARLVGAATIVFTLVAIVFALVFVV